MAMTFDEFLSYAVSDCVNANHEGAGTMEAAALRDELRETGGTGDPGAWAKVECGDCGSYVRSLRTHICLTAPPAIRVACTGPRGLASCGRVREDGGWGWPRRGEDVTKLEQGICPTCLAVQMQRAELQRAREGRELLLQRERGYGPGEGDPFNGMREEE